nr:hypothetical protein [Candidatus Njordarchaeum guaymaensis]
MKTSLKLLIPVTIVVAAGLALSGLGVVFYYYESRYSGLLPVISYPYREYALPVGIAGVLLLVVALLALLLIIKRR